MAKNLCLAKEEIRKVSVRLIIDERRKGKDELCPVIVRVTKDRKFFDVTLSERYSPDTFTEIWIAEAEKTKKYKDERQRMRRQFEQIVAIVRNLIESERFSRETFKIKYYGLIDPNEETIYSLWQDVADSKSVGTAASYNDALARFKKDMGGKVRFEDITKELTRRWQDRMIADGLSKTTAAIYLRAFKVVCNVAIEREYLKADGKQLFAKMQIAGKNSYNSRKHEYLTIEQWQALWRFYETNGAGNDVYESWRSDYKESNMNALGMMLFMYLADGMNLRDVLNLRYDDFYFSHDKTQFRFIRQKVSDRTAAEIVFPILPEIRTIIERQGEKETEDGLVFGYLKDKIRFDGSRKDIEEERRLTALYNSVIRARMVQVAKAVGISQLPSPTWCRHSFATNLIQQGVSKEYISASMGHSGGSTTDNYIDKYSYQQMVDNNSLLLHAESEKDRLLKLLAGMSKEERDALLKGF